MANLYQAAYEWRHENIETVIAVNVENLRVCDENSEGASDRLAYLCST